jgi:hypothetical protein
MQQVPQGYQSYTVRKLSPQVGFNLTDWQDPFQDVLETQIEIWEADAWDNSIFVGPPSEKLDDAWDKLQRGTFVQPLPTLRRTNFCSFLVQGIRVFPEEISQLDLNSKIHLKNGDQGAIMGYFHNLHCIVSSHTRRLPSHSLKDVSFSDISTKAYTQRLIHEAAKQHMQRGTIMIVSCSSTQSWNVSNN